ncbi:thioesterase family protein [Brevundimonas aveniformis]|uniref:thioesterase family protein n=1 Tax=Brevundimonas aveniformis TaxID=370977 RepID=UPI0004162F31|nr:thioesterase family protein [Brevundimonas aveniformis]
MTDQTLPEALSLTRNGEALSAYLTGGFSNGPQGGPPEAGAPFGGLLAALAAKAMREGLDLTSPLRTLSVQYLAAARFEREIMLRPRTLRGGRRVAYTALEAFQGDRLTLHATATWGRDAPSVALAPLTAPPPPRDDRLIRDQLSDPLSPWFTRQVDYIYVDGPNIFGGNVGKPPIERVWMRTRDGAPLDADRLCFLLDALYPPAWTAFTSPPMMTSVDLRYDLLADPTPELCPDGWAFFEFTLLDIGLGWSVDDVVCRAADGTPLAVARQRRKIL